LYNAETDPEVKAVMRDMGKDLDRWITEDEIKDAADIMEKLPERNKKFMEKKLNKLKREMELFGPQAVVS
jgi:fructose-specific phosphotransferase system component IIB